MTVVVKAPADCAKAEIDMFCKLVREAGEIEPSGLGARVKRALALIFLTTGKDLAGVAALKAPNSKYRDRVFRKAHAHVLAADFPIELGWVVVLHAYRGGGLSHILVQHALNRAEGQNVFATTKDENAAMHRVLAQSGFVKEDQSYDSDRGKYRLRLYLYSAKKG